MFFQNTQNSAYESVRFVMKKKVLYFNGKVQSLMKMK